MSSTVSIASSVSSGQPTVEHIKLRADVRQRRADRRLGQHHGLVVAARQSRIEVIPGQHASVAVLENSLSVPTNSSSWKKRFSIGCALTRRTPTSPPPPAGTPARPDPPNPTGSPTFAIDNGHHGAHRPDEVAAARAVVRRALAGTPDWCLPGSWRDRDVPQVPSPLAAASASISRAENRSIWRVMGGLQVVEVRQGHGIDRNLLGGVRHGSDCPAVGEEDRCGARRRW